MDDLARKSSREMSEDESSVTSGSTIRSSRARSTATTKRQSPSASASDAKSAVPAVNGKSDTDKGPKLPDIFLEWTDVEINFTLSKTRKANPRMFYPLFPPPSDLTAIPSVKSINSTPAVTSPKRPNTTLSSYLDSTNHDPLWSPSKSANNPSKVKNSSNVVPKKCPKCDRTFNKSSQLKAHLSSHANQKPFKCEICNWGFYQKDNLVRHMASHTQAAVGGLKCQHCDAPFSTQAVLAIHLRDAHGERSSPATTPKILNPRLSSSLSGITKNHPVKVRLPIASDIHGATPKSPPSSPFSKFSPGVQKLPTVAEALKKSTLSHLPTAAQVMTGSKIVSPLTGIKVLNPKVPISMTGGRPVQVRPSGSSPGCRCQTCGKLFLTSSNLLQHMQNHKINKPNKCNYCEARFAQANNLAKHIEFAHSASIQKSPQGFPCSQCSITFKTSSDVEDHKILVHGSTKATTNGILPGFAVTVKVETESD